MGEKLVVGPIDRGLRTDRIPAVIDNDSFPTLINAYQWRGRIKRKRGTSFLCRLERFFSSNGLAYTGGVVVTAPVDGSGNGSLKTGFSGYNLPANSSIVPGTVTIVDTTSLISYTDPTQDGFLTPTGTSGPNTINYATGGFQIPAASGHAVIASFSYYPTLPVMGLEPFSTISSQFDSTVAFDTTYSYAIDSNFPHNAHDVSFYKNPSTSASLPGYTPKTLLTPLIWNGEDYQQFWTTNFEGAMWATNGISIPFNINGIGMQFKSIVTVTVITATTATLNIVGHGLVVGDFVFVNEVATTTGINFQTGYVTTVTDANNVIVTFPNATLAGNGTGGIAQYLTNNADTTVDPIRWYDGDPLGDSGLGWVNFSPPLSEFAYSIADTPARQYYLVGCRMIIPFKDRLLFLGPVIQTSSAGSQIYLQDTIIYSQNGTPYYNASFTGSVTSVTTQFFSMIAPNNLTATASAYFEDQTGYGGFRSAGLDQPIIGAGGNEDALIVGFPSYETNFVYTADDLNPFNFYLINSELGTGSTFSVINMDKGIISRGQRGYTITSQIECARIDLDIPDQYGEVKLTQNGNERFCSQRDFLNEWIYFTYPSNMWGGKFPDQTLQFNYRDNSWAVFNECYTHYGTFIAEDGLTWGNVGSKYPTWEEWTVPWNASQTTVRQPDVIAGNQQGFVVLRDDGTGESISMAIKSITNSTITSPDYDLNTGDYIIISGAIGTVAAEVNGKIFSILEVDNDTFILNPTITAGLTYGGLGVITRMYVPLIQTKEFPVAWSMMRKTRIGNQAYLFTVTPNAQITVQIYLSQNSANPYNTPFSDALIYQTTLYTCVESTNIGLTPSNTNLQMIASIAGNLASTPSARLWHRINTSLVGDTVQIGFTLSDEQMRTVDANGQPISQFAEIELHGFTLDVSPSSMLA